MSWHHRPAFKGTQKGMSLLEVLAAMVILSIGASIAFTWFNQSAMALAQVKDQEAELLARDQALEYLQHINPDKQPSGQVDMPGFQMEWHEQAVYPPARSVTDLGQASAYTVSLHQLDVVLRKNDAKQKDWVSFKLRLAGYVHDEGTQSLFGGGRSP
jgi:prepilin-type N-terminal cleavage/methylation domain-containing protein